MNYLLDTDVLSALLRSQDGLIARRIARVGVDNICTSIVVAGELRFGALKRGSRTLASRLNDLLETLEVLPLEDHVDEIYGGIRNTLERSGNLIGANDMWIAAHAVAINATVVTGNMQEFSRVPGLKVENWLQ